MPQEWTLVKRNDDISTWRHLRNQTIVKTADTSQGEMLLVNEARFLKELRGTGFVPHIFLDEPDRIVMQDLGESETVIDPDVFRRNAILLLNTLNIYRIKHGDLTDSNVIIKNDRPMAIDWCEAVRLDERREGKRPEPDSYHLWNVVAANRDTARTARRWIAIRDALGIDNLSGKSLIDLGCHKGDFVAAASVDGMIATGIDRNSKAIEEARRIWKDVPNAGFFDYEIIEFLNGSHTVHFDVLLMLSTWPYIVQDYGELSARTVLGMAKERCDILFFESQLFKDGPGPPFFKTDDDVASTLSEIGSVEKVVTLRVCGRNAARSVFMVT